MQIKKDRDAIVALLAIGGAMADPELAAELKLDGIPTKQTILLELATAVRTLQSPESHSVDERSKSRRDLIRILAQFGIEFDKTKKIQRQILHAANEWGLAWRAYNWAQKHIQKPFLRPVGTRGEVIDKIKTHGFSDD